MERRVSRRAVVKGALIAGVIRPNAEQWAIAAEAELPPLDPSDPTAKALGFVTDTSKVDAGANPTHKPTQKCGTCAQFQGKSGDARGGCNIFSGHSVPQGGWCKVWAQKPGG